MLEKLDWWSVARLLAEIIQEMSCCQCLPAFSFSKISGQHSPRVSTASDGLGSASRHPPPYHTRLSFLLIASIQSHRPISSGSMSYIAGIPCPPQLPQRRTSHILSYGKSDTQSLLRPSPHHPFHPCKRRSPESVAELRNLRK